MKKQFIRILLVAVIIACTWVSFNEVVLKPFPFMNVTYVNPAEWGEAPKGFTEIPIDDEISTSLTSVLDKLSALSNLDSKIEYASSIVRDVMRASSGNVVRTAAEDILSDNSAYMSVCSESAKVFAVIMQLAGIPSRVVWMHGHTVSEVWNGEKWVPIDTFGNVAAFDIDGEPLGVREVIQDFQAAEFRKVVEDSNSEPPQYFDTG